ncbi:hypothetical protein [Shewanella litorisediminis]|uniref:Uncharacterized protein n=1 Tax=Shewanella litorisediminis TaxID=1173586 RepID=A0ABX7G741_9GAMM|nr:hypothetical protein [Shewanella litorisediminis]MCL2916640.1 hypothetical protein [Shewanella litorisediminis]QRH03182.1 hypothetical protein JQC75_07205 [Shewanella litorisediminis]
MNVGLLWVLVFASVYVLWLWRCFRWESQSFPRATLLAGLASTLIVLLTSVNLMLLAAALGVFAPSQTMLLCCVFSLFYGIKALWLAGLGWLGELPQALGSRWLWLGSAALSVTSLLACGLFDSISL